MEIVECDHAFAHFWGNEMLEVVENGGQGRNRTADASLFRAALYQLSYLARLPYWLNGNAREGFGGTREDVLHAKVIITIANDNQQSAGSPPQER